MNEPDIINEAEREPQPVDRERRFRFISAVVGFCLLAASTFVLLAAFVSTIPVYNIDLIEMFVGGCLSLATITTVTYVTGEVVDYNGIKGLFGRSTRRNDYTLPTEGPKG